MCYNYTYDGFGRLMSVDVNGKTCVTHEYTENKDEQTGHLLSAEKKATLAGGEAFVTRSDAKGRVEKISCDGTVLKQAEEYDANNRCLKYTEFPDSDRAKTHTATYSKKEDTHTAGNVQYLCKKDALLRPETSTYTFGEDVVQKYAYTYEEGFSGKLKTMVWNDHLTQCYTYDKLGRLIAVSVKSGDTSLLCTKTQYLKYGDHATNMVMSRTHANGDVERYGYNTVGHVETVTENGKLKARYTYDKLDRLITKSMANTIKAQKF